MTRHFVTIGVTAFNAVETIERALDSALAQTWRPIEIVVIDDCSSDGTLQVLDRLAALHPEIRVFSNLENGGVARSRNRILQEARGAFVAFFDDDDVSEPQRVAVQLERILKYEQQFAAGAPVICHTARRVVYPGGYERIESTMGQREDVPAPSGPKVARRILAGSPLPHAYGACATCSQMARLATYRDLGGFDPALRRSEDTEFNIRLALAGGHFVGVKAPLVTQMMNRTSEKSLVDEFRQMRRVAEKHRAIFEGPSEYEFCRRWLDGKQAWLQGCRVRFLLSAASLALCHPLLTVRRLALSLPSTALNRAHKRYYLAEKAE